MARKKTATKNSNSYWMKFGGTPRKMHKGGFTHPHPHPKDATDEQLRGANIWSGYSNLDKRTTYTWDDEESTTAGSDVAAFKQTRWFDFFPDTSKNIPQTKKELIKYEKAINAHNSRTIELYDTKFDDFSDLMYATTTLIRGAAAVMPPVTPQTAVGKGALWVASFIPAGLKGGWDWYKRDWNAKTKEANPGAIFVNPDGDILNYEDNEYSLFNSFIHDRGVKKVRTMPSDEEIEKNTGNRDDNTVIESDPLQITKEKKVDYETDADNFIPDVYQKPVYGPGGVLVTPGSPANWDDRNDAYVKKRRETEPKFTLDQLPKKTYGGSGGVPVNDHTPTGTNPTTDPTFKMWFAKNARRPDVMQSSGNTEALKQIFFKDINFSGNNMPLFSGEIDAYGKVDKSNRSMDLSEQIIGGMQKYGGMPKYEGGGDPDSTTGSKSTGITKFLLGEDQNWSDAKFDKLEYWWPSEGKQGTGQPKIFKNDYFSGEDLKEGVKKGLANFKNWGKESFSDFKSFISEYDKKGSPFHNKDGTLRPNPFTQGTQEYERWMKAFMDESSESKEKTQKSITKGQGVNAQVPLDPATMKYGGMPKAELGMGQGLYQSPTEGAMTDYSGSDSRMDNFQMKLGEVGDSGFMKTFNYVVPGLGTALDIFFDYQGYRGEKKAHQDLQTDASRSRDNLTLLGKPNANKETLDLSTRVNALTHKASYNKQGPDFWDDFGKEAVGDVASAYAGGQFDSWGGGGGMGGGDMGDAVPPIDIPEGDALVKYGGRPKAGHGGHMAAESGMDLRDLHSLAMGGGANQFQPGLTAAMINGEVNPLSHNQQFKASGIEQAFAAGGDTQQTDQYEAEGGEVIMHGPGEVPVTTGETEQIDGGTNDSMLSMLEGKSHDQADASGQTGEVVEGDGNQYVFSKSLKSKIWETNFAKAAEKIGKHIARFKKEAEKGDGITQTTAMSMIDAWNKKLTDLQQEQEKARQTKFMEMVEGGAQPEQLQEAFPDLFQQFMQQQQESQLSASANNMEGQAQMAANPMGDIDMSQLSAEEQQLVGAQYGLPNKEYGDPFEAYDFNRYFGEIQGEGMFEGIEQGNFELGNDYFGKKSGIMDFLEMNYPDGGYKFGDETFTNSKDMYNAMQTDFGTRRNTFLEDVNTSTTKPDQDDYMKTIQQLNPASGEMEESWDWASETSQADYKGDKARYKLYNSGLPGNWDENYGRDADISRRKYFRTLETQLLADGKSKEEINSIIKREKLKMDEQLNLEAIEKENAPLTDKEKAEALKKKLAREAMGQKGKEFLTQTVKDMTTLAPTLYNMKKGKEGAEVEPFVENENEALIKENLNRLSNLDITLSLKENEDNFNQLKYLARDASDGSSGSMMNTLLRGQHLQNEADAKLYAGKTKADQLGLKIANESLYNLGEKDRTEGVRVNEANAKNRAAVEAFKAKGWEGLSGFGQLKEQMANQASRDEQLKGLLHQIYPDAHLYTDRDGTMDINKLIESGELDKLMKENPKLAEIFMNYFNTEDE